MNILITNDDGIMAAGILAVAKWAVAHGDVTVVAPKEEQSAKSQGINIRTPFEVKTIEYPLPVKAAYSVDSTPADCVRVALDTLGEKFDLVISGINKGVNVGEDIAYSATAGAIFEAAYHGVPAVAVSTFPDTLDGASSHLEDVFDFFVNNKLMTFGKLFNVNIPEKSKGIKITKQGGPYFRDHYVKNDNGTYQAKGYMAWKDSGDFTTDTDAVMNGYVSVSPLTVCRTDWEVYNKIK